jgi:hypothetical protein
MTPLELKVAPQFGASLTDDSRVVIYDLSMLIIQATGSGNKTGLTFLSLKNFIFFFFEIFLNSTF